MNASLAFQILGTGAGISGAVLTVFKKRGCWVAYGISNVSLSIVFIIGNIYIPILQYLAFTVINIAGWIKWSQHRKEKAELAMWLGRFFYAYQNFDPDRLRLNNESKEAFISIKNRIEAGK